MKLRETYYSCNYYSCKLSDTSQTVIAHSLGMMRLVWVLETKCVTRPASLFRRGATVTVWLQLFGQARRSWSTYWSGGVQRAGQGPRLHGSTDRSADSNELHRSIALRILIDSKYCTRMAN